MKAFADSAGRTWTLAVTVDAVCRVRDLVGVNLARIVEPREAGGPVPLLTDLEDDILLLVDVLFALVKPQADSQNVTDEEFGRALGGEALAAAHEAFWQELSDFFRSLKRPAEARAIEKQLAVVGAAMALAEKKIQALDVETLLAQGEAGPATAKPTGEAGMDGGSSSSAPASSGATPAP